jgi:hypothetical protein
MALFRLLFDADTFNAYKHLFPSGERCPDRNNVWVRADNKVQVALMFPEATIHSFIGLVSWDDEDIDYVIE